MQVQKCTALAAFFGYPNILQRMFKKLVNAVKIKVEVLYQEKLDTS